MTLPITPQQETILATEIYNSLMSACDGGLGESAECWNQALEIINTWKEKVEEKAAAELNAKLQADMLEHADQPQIEVLIKKWGSKGESLAGTIVRGWKAAITLETKLRDDNYNFKRGKFDQEFSVTCTRMDHKY